MLKNTKCLFNKSKSTEGMVSISQIQSYMSCSKKWEYGYVENLTPRVERSYLSIGKLCHKGMETAMRKLWEIYSIGKNRVCYEVYYEIQREALTAMEHEWDEYMSSVQFLDEEIPDQEQILEDAKSVFKQALKEFNPLKYEVVSVVRNGKMEPALELHFVVPCPYSKGLHGYIDAILKDKETGFIWCTDYKFRKSLSPDDEESVNLQNAVYTHACNMMGINITGTMTWQHCNTPAMEPQMLKSGGVSRSKIKTTWEKYKYFCIEHGVDPEPYEQEMVEKLSDIEWFRPTYEYRNEIFTNRVWKESVVPASRSIKAAYGKAKSGTNYRSIYPWNCKMCQYRSLCQGELRDYDADKIRTLEYTVRSRGRSVNKPLDTSFSDVL